MVAISLVQGISSLPAIVSGVESLVGLFRGGGRPQGITAAQQAALSGGFGGPTTSTGTATGPTFASSVPPTQASVGGGLIRALPRILPAAGGAAIAEVGSRMLLGAPPGPRTVTRRQFILMNARSFSPGATAKKIIRSARECGIELAAATFGLDVLDVCFLIAQPPTRRSRGISAADMRRTRSTIRKVNTIQASLKQLSGPIRRRK